MERNTNYLEETYKYYSNRLEYCEKRIKELEIKETQLASFVGYTQFLCMNNNNVMKVANKIKLCEFCIDRISKVETEQYQEWVNEYRQLLKKLQDGTL